MRFRQLLIFVLLITEGCTEVIDLDINRDAGQLIVYGHIDDGNNNFYVTLTRTSGRAFEFFPVQGARITLLDDEGNEGLFSDGDENGHYTFNQNSLPISAGKSYHIHIRLPDNSIYESLPECIPETKATPAIHVEYEKININTGSAAAVVERNIMRVFAETSLSNNSGTSYVRWDVTQTFFLELTNFPDPFNSIPPPCFIIRPIDVQRLPLFATDHLIGNIIPDLLVAQTEIDHTFLTKNIITVQTQVQTKEAYEYYRKIRSLLTNTGSIFDTPSAAVPGNIINVEDPSEVVLGYFDASSSALNRIQTTRDDFDFPVPASGCIYDPDFPNTDDYPETCVVCQANIGGTYQRPSYY